MTKESNDCKSVDSTQSTVTEDLISMLTLIQKDMDFINDDLESSIDRLTGTVNVEEAIPNMNLTLDGVEGNLGVMNKMLAELYYSTRRVLKSATRLNRIA